MALVLQPQKAASSQPRLIVRLKVPPAFVHDFPSFDGATVPAPAPAVQPPQSRLVIKLKVGSCSMKKTAPATRAFKAVEQQLVDEVQLPVTSCIPPPPHRNVSTLLPPQRPEHKGRHTLVLDMDETLIHAVRIADSAAAATTTATTDRPSINLPTRADFQVKSINSHKVWDVYRRPGVDHFLQAMAASYEVVVFTSAGKSYADPILDELNKVGSPISHRLYKDSCKKRRDRLTNKKSIVKDLRHLGRSLTKVVIVDDRPSLYARNPDNGLCIPPFVGDPSDHELQHLAPYLTEMCQCADVTQAIVGM